MLWCLHEWLKHDAWNWEEDTAFFIQPVCFLNFTKSFHSLTVTLFFFHHSWNRRLQVLWRCFFNIKNTEMRTIFWGFGVVNRNIFCVFFQQQGFKAKIPLRSRGCYLMLSFFPPNVIYLFIYLYLPSRRQDQLGATAAIKFTFCRRWLQIIQKTGNQRR